MNQTPNNYFKNALIVSAIFGVLSSAVMYNVMTSHAFDIDVEFQQEGLGKDGDTARTCQVMFDTYLLSTQVWKNRLSNFAQDFFRQIISQAFAALFCAIPEVETEEGVSGGIVVFGFDFSLITDVIRKPECTVGLGDISVSSALKDTAERQLLYNNIARCQSTKMVNDITDAAQRVYNENGRSGGSTAILDYKAFLTDSEARGFANARNILANTHYCPWIQKEMEAIFNFSPDDAVPISTNVDNGIEPYGQRAACTFGPDVKTSDLLGNANAMLELSKPQNNLLGAYLMAKTEISRQINLELEADKTNALANQGNLGTSGTTEENSCEVFDAQGNCIQFIPNNTTGWNLNQQVANTERAELDILVNSNAMGQLLADTRRRIVSRMQNFAHRQVDVAFQADYSTELYGDSDPGTIEERRADDNKGCGVPSETQCSCLVNDPSAQEFGKALLLSAIGQAGRQNPFLFIGQNINGPLLPGKNVEFIQKVCLLAGLADRGCRPYLPRADDVILVPGPDGEVAIDIIRADGTPRRDPTVKYSCALNVFP